MLTPEPSLSPLKNTLFLSSRPSLPTCSRPRPRSAPPGGAAAIRPLGQKCWKKLLSVESGYNTSKSKGGTMGFFDKLFPPEINETGKEIKCYQNRCESIVQPSGSLKGWIKTSKGKYYCSKHKEEGKKAVEYDRNDKRANPECPLNKVSPFGRSNVMTFGSITKNPNAYPCSVCSRRMESACY